MKKIIAFLLVFGVGLAAGYFLKPEKKTEEKGISAQDKEKISLELDLLQEYLNFAVLPPEKFSDPDNYAAGMELKARSIGDEELLKKYQATGDEENSEEKLLVFFSTIIEKIRNQTK